MTISNQLAQLRATIDMKMEDLLNSVEEHEKAKDTVPSGADTLTLAQRKMVNELVVWGEMQAVLRKLIVHYPHGHTEEEESERLQDWLILLRDQTVGFPDPYHERHLAKLHELVQSALNGEKHG